MFEGITDIARTHVYGDHSLTIGNIATTMIAIAIMWFQPFGKLISVALAVAVALIGMALFQGRVQHDYQIRPRPNSTESGHNSRLAVS